MIRLRIATPEDGAALAEIYGYYVKNTAISFEYEAPDKDEFSRRIEHKLEKYPYIVAEIDGRPVGYAYASEFRERAAYDWDAELSVYVDKDERYNGVGQMLYTALIELLKAQNFVNLYAWITTPNPTSEKFHEKIGFSKLCEIPKVGYKNERWYGITWYCLSLSDGAPKPIIPFPNLDRSHLTELSLPSMPRR